MGLPPPDSHMSRIFVFSVKGPMMSSGDPMTTGFALSSPLSSLVALSRVADSDFFFNKFSGAGSVSSARLKNHIHNMLKAQSIYTHIMNMIL